MAAQTVLHHLHQNAQAMPHAPAYYEKVGDDWVATSWADYLAQVRQAARALISLGVGQGQPVCILGFNRPEWVIFDLAGMLAGGAATGIYTTNSPSEVRYIVDHAESPVILLEDEGQWEKVRQELDNLPHLEHVVMMRGAATPDHPIALSWEEFLAQGDEVPEHVADERLDGLEMDQLATLIYTSGTTGPPKGVMLSHENLVWTAQTAATLFDIGGADDSSLSYLPLSHIAEQMFSIHGPIVAGWPVYFAESPLKVADNLKEVRPTIVFGVPRVWERFYNGVTARLGEASGVRAKLIDWARGVGTEVTDLRNRGGEPSGGLALQYRLAERLVFSKLHAALGLDRAKLCVSGAAPVSRDILEFFASLDIPIYEVYGQTEGSGPSSFNHPGRTKFGSVGPPFPGDEIKIADDGEILVRGPNICLGYYKDDAATAETLNDGWLYSGDLGSFDDEGFLHITGRKKEIIITSGGKNIAPKNIEAALKNIELVADAIVIGEQRRYLTALLTLEPDAIARFAQEHGIHEGALHEHPAVVTAVQQGIDQVNKEFARVETVRGFRILPEPFSVESGELTPTLKLKRRVVYDKYGDEIEEMYGE